MSEENTGVGNSFPWLPDRHSAETESVDLGPERQFIVFTVGNVFYAALITKVYEILRTVPITPMPRAPVYVEGVINLRGRIIPIVDLRKRFAEIEPVDGRRTRFLIIDVQNRHWGLIVDSVTEVIRLRQGEIEPPLPVAGAIRTEFIEGIGKRDGKLIVIVDVEKIIKAEEGHSLALPDAPPRAP